MKFVLISDTHGSKKDRYDLTGKQFNSWYVIRSVGKKRGRVHYWLCRCVCGREREVKTTNIFRNISKSCGCSAIGVKNVKFDKELAAYRAKVSNYKSHAKIDGRDWLLSYEQAVDLLKKNCHYCGSPPSNTYNISRNRTNKSLMKKTKEFHVSILYNGIDRVDSSLGYTPENCVSCCKICNQAKMDMTLEKYESWINNLIAFRASK